MPCGVPRGCACTCACVCVCVCVQGRHLSPSSSIGHCWAHACMAAHALRVVRLRNRKPPCCAAHRLARGGLSSLATYHLVRLIQQHSISGCVLPGTSPVSAGKQLLEGETHPRAVAGACKATAHVGLFQKHHAPLVFIAPEEFVQYGPEGSGRAGRAVSIFTHPSGWKK